MTSRELKNFITLEQLMKAKKVCYWFWFMGGDNQIEMAFVPLSNNKVKRIETKINWKGERKNQGEVILDADEALGSINDAIGNNDGTVLVKYYYAPKSLAGHRTCIPKVNVKRMF